MAGTIARLQAFEEYVGTAFADSANGSSETEKRLKARQFAADAHCKVLDLHNFDKSDPVTRALRDSHMQGKFEPSRMLTDDILRFLVDRYQINPSGDYLESCALRGIGLLAWQKAECMRKLLQTTGIHPNLIPISKVRLNARRQSTDTKCLAQRKVERKEIAAFMPACITEIRRALGLQPGIVPSEAVIEAGLGKDLLIVETVPADDEDVAIPVIKGFAATKAFSGGDPGWRSSIYVKGKGDVEIPRQASTSLPSVAVTKFGYEFQTYMSATVRAIIALLEEFPDHVPRAELQWCEKP